MLLNLCSSVRLEDLHRPSHRLNAILAWCAGLFLFVILYSANAQQLHDTNQGKVLPSFEVAAIKPSKADVGHHSFDSTSDRISIQNYTLSGLVIIAYGLKSQTQVSGGPDWMNNQAFDIYAKMDDTEVAKLREMKREDRQKERGLLLQSLLSDRFQLRVHKVKKTMPVYALVVAKSGAKLTQSDPSLSGHTLSSSNGHMEARSISIDAFVDELTRMPESGNRVVVNRTSLHGNFDFKMNWTADYGSGIQDTGPYPGLLTALKEQLGLKLKSQKAPVDAIVVDGAARPTID